jgi:5'-nucleotidase
MRILITNDDGINAPGLRILRDIAKKISDDVWVVAPESNQSGTSHSMTLHEPLRCRDVAERMIAVNGTPTDCVILALRHLMLDNPPDLLLSGVNHGSNLAEDVTYSGTVAAAMEGTLLGVRSIAFSLMTGIDDTGKGRARWETPLAHAPSMIEKLLDSSWSNGVVMNVNFPDLPPDEIHGVEVTSQGQRDQALLHIDKRSDPWGTPYFWFGFGRRHATLVDGTDLSAIARGFISLTPLTLDLTHRAEIERLASAWTTAAPVPSRARR